MLKDNYIDYIREIRRYSPRTQDIYESVIDGFIEFSCPDGGSDEALKEALTPVMIRNYEVYLMDDRAEDPRTVNLHLSVLSGFCRYLIRKDIILSNPVRLVARPKTSKRIPVFYRDESMEEYFKNTEQDAGEENLEMLQAFGPSAGKDKTAIEMYRRRLSRMIISLLSNTGIRRSELVGLKVGSADLGRKVLKVLGKGDKMREIPLINSLCNEISLYLQSVDTMVGCQRSADDPLLVTEKGRKLYPVYVDRVIKSELGGIKSITGRKSPHVLRHTLATELLNNGTDLYSIKELLGHSSLAATQVYTHNSIEKLKNVYNNAHPRAKSGGNYGDSD